MALLFIIILVTSCCLLALQLRKSITERKDREKEVASLKEKCREYDKESRLKDVYLQNMSHEIRTPLNAVTGFAQLLAMPDDIISLEEKREYNDYIVQNTNLLVTIIDDIQNISEIKSGNYVINKSQYPLNNICTSAIASIKYKLPASILLSFTSDFDDGYTINTDMGRVQQILINLLSNAIKHTKEGSILLHCSKDEHPGKVTFSVTDTGEGIPLEKADDIFCRFTKLNDNVEGYGLGLNICRTLAEKLDGSIYLDKQHMGKGARFVFEHPAE